MRMCVRDPACVALADVFSMHPKCQREGGGFRAREGGLRAGAEGDYAPASGYRCKNRRTRSLSRLSPNTISAISRELCPILSSSRICSC